MPMSDDIENVKIGGISPSEYVRGIKNGNIDPTYDNAIMAILWAADEIERLREAKPLLREDANAREIAIRALKFVKVNTKRGFLTEISVAMILVEMERSGVKFQKGLRWCSCRASERAGQHMAWCPAGGMR